MENLYAHYFTTFQILGVFSARGSTASGKVEYVKGGRYYRFYLFNNAIISSLLISKLILLLMSMVDPMTRPIDLMLQCTWVAGCAMQFGIMVNKVTHGPRIAELFSAIKCIDDSITG